MKTATSQPDYSILTSSAVVEAGLDISKSVISCENLRVDALSDEGGQEPNETHEIKRSWRKIYIYIFVSLIGTWTRV